MNSKILKTVDYTHINGGSMVSTERIIKETALTIRINGKHYATAMIMAALEKEFIYGHLFAQGIIRSANDIKSLTIQNNTAEVRLAAIIIAKTAADKVDSSLIVTTADVFNCVRAILKSDVFAETEAVHSAGLFLDGKKTVCIAEDLGRHHALDKVIGYGLLNDIDFSRTLAASTGRQPSEMIYKCVNANIPIIATKGVPTTLAIEIAEKTGITIAGLVRGKTMTVYSRPERIE
ncbi:MAG: formate dehydrogenase family accessory protein FdhD [Chloroflexi bacterium RBG_13_51_18]|nr:MAG: formate dehydrogenase family accessory protein FdhD [Chloroflexi bacterium RBG_13_51_18]